MDVHCLNPQPPDPKFIKTHTGLLLSNPTPKCRYPESGSSSTRGAQIVREEVKLRFCLDSMSGVLQASSCLCIRLSEHLSFICRFCPGHRTGDILQNRPIYQPVLVLLSKHWRLPPGHPGSSHAHLEHSSQERGLHGTPSDSHQPLPDCTVSSWAGQ